MTEPATRHERELSGEDRARLADAHRALRDAVATYDQFLGGELVPGEPVPVTDGEQLRAAQEAVEAAERRLWELREELLDWPRPPWAPSATLTADWFSDEDAVYDDVPETTAS